MAGLKKIDSQTASAVNAALELKKQHMDRFFARRQVEWRVSIALWASFAAIANAGRDINLSDRGLVILIGGVIGLTTLHGWWAWAHSVRAAPDNRDAGLDIEDAVRLAIGLDALPERKTYLSTIHYWPALVTLLLGLGTVAVIRLS
ncbi:MAG: hypothetical protein IH941_08345 [Acidobacteria bacterium]|nr:hypothetical protein [Acidobacteriota bacterium]